MSNSTVKNREIRNHLKELVTQSTNQASEANSYKKWKKNITFLII